MSGPIIKFNRPDPVEKIIAVPDAVTVGQGGEVVMDPDRIAAIIELPFGDQRPVVIGNEQARKPDLFPFVRFPFSS